MWLTQFRWPILLVTLFSLTACMTNSPPPQRVVVVRPVIMTPVPPPRDVMVIPVGYATCHMAPGRWMYSTWIPPHHVCRYAHNPQKVTWVEGYWSCANYSMKGQCKAWVWHSAQWYNRVVVY